ncbi:STAS domain-containing protein [Streptomyces aurantiogriseus]|uniref:STAS domain-containing protein n=1 Tax=Streptomyces aurantiogriseus TaxID=66870 RepID=UPI0035711BDD
MSGTIRDFAATGPDGCLVVVAGGLDLVTAPDVRRARRAAVGRHRRVIVGLDQVAFCDCAGVSALVAAARTARARGVGFRLRSVSHFLARFLRLTGPHGAFSIGPGPESGRGRGACLAKPGRGEQRYARLGVGSRRRISVPPPWGWRIFSVMSNRALGGASAVAGPDPRRGRSALCFRRRSWTVWLVRPGAGGGRAGAYP